MLDRSVEIVLALVVLGLAVLALLVWIPFDSETPPIYTFRRQTYIGDAMLPMIAAAGIALCSLIHLLINLRRKPAPFAESPFDRLTIAFFMQLAAIIVVALLLMFWAGPAALSLFGLSGEEALTYRQMRSSLPWKYVGFVMGGFVLVFGIISLVEGRFRWKRALVAIVAVAALILIFDVPFDVLLLPPNGDF